MQNNSRKVLDTLVSRTKIYLAIIFVLLVIICVLNTELILPAVCIYILILIYSYYANNKRKSEISETLQDLTLTVDSAAKTSLINSPFPLLILETNGSIIWKSSKFVSEFANIDMKTYVDDLTQEITEEIEKQGTSKSDIIKQIQIGEKSYKVLGKYVNVKKKEKKAKKEYMIMLYFIDDTENMKLQKEYKDSKSCIAIIMIDNYEETMQGLESEEKPQVIAQIEKCIYDWTNKTNGVLIKTEKDRYIYLFEQRY